MANPVIHHSVTTGAAADPTALVDGPAWDAAHVITGLENVPNVDTTNASNLSSGTIPAARLAATGKPFVILFSGQSNPEAISPYSWSPNPNAKFWNGGREGAVGTAFAPLDQSNIQLPAKIASDIADANLTRPVYVIGVFQSGTAISHWLSGTPAPDVYATIGSNVTAALSAIGVTKIDQFCWWQGESDVGSSTYAGDFSTLLTRLQTNSWFPRETPILAYALCSDTQAGSGGFGTINNAIQSVVNADPDFRRLIYTPSLVGSTFWRTIPDDHMTAQGYFSAGAMGASAILSGGRPNLPGANYDIPSDIWTFDRTLFVGSPSPPSGTVNALAAVGAGAGNGAGSFVSGINGGATSWAVGNLSGILGGATPYDNSLQITSPSYVARFFTANPASGTHGAVAINGARAGNDAGSFISGINAGVTTWAIGNLSAVQQGGTAYDASLQLNASNYAARFFASSPAAGTHGAVAINGAGSGNDGGSFLSGINAGTTVWSIGNRSAVQQGGTAYDATCMLSSVSGMRFRVNTTTFAGSINTAAVPQWVIGTDTTAATGSGAGPTLTVTRNAGTLPNVSLFNPIAQFAAADGNSTDFILQAFGSGKFPAVRYAQARGTAASPTATQSGDNIGGAFAYALNTTAGAAYTPNAGIIMIATDNCTSTTTGARLDLYATAQGTAALAIGASIGAGVMVGDTVDPGAGAISATASIKSKGALYGIGYAPGAGGAVTQATNRTTGVTLNNVTGAITLVSAAGSATPASFTVTNSTVAATDVIKVCQKSGADLYQIFVTAVGAGSFKITFFTTGGTTAEQPVFNFVVIKGVTS
jgi:hypothetical protein